MSSATTPPDTSPRQILSLAVPAFLALVAESVFLLVDSAVVGRLGVTPLAGLGAAGAVLMTMAGVFVFLAYGTTAAVARRVGAGQLRAAIEDGWAGIWLALGLGVAVTTGQGVAAADTAGPSMDSTASSVGSTTTSAQNTILRRKLSSGSPRHGSVSRIVTPSSCVCTQ